MCPAWVDLQLPVLEELNALMRTSDDGDDLVVITGSDHCQHFGHVTLSYSTGDLPMNNQNGNVNLLEVFRAIRR